MDKKKKQKTILTIFIYIILMCKGLIHGRFSQNQILIIL